MDGEGIANLEEEVREGFLEFVTIKDYNEEVNCKDIWGKMISNRGISHSFVHSFIIHSFNMEHLLCARNYSRSQGYCEKQDKISDLQEHIPLKCK